MSEPSKYGFRKDKAKEEFADATTLNTIKALALDVEISQAKITVPANSMQAYNFIGSPKSLPMPVVNLMTVRNTNLLQVQSGVDIYVFGSNIITTNGQKKRVVQVWVQNANAFTINAWVNVQWMIRTYGEDFPDGQAWPMDLS